MNPVAGGTWDRRRWLALLLLPLLVAAALYLPGIGRRLIYAGDEARYAILARTMLENGDRLVPRLSGEVRMAKTPLFIWSIAALSLPGGKVTELTAVLPAAGRPNRCLAGWTYLQGGVRMGSADSADHACSGAPGCDASGTEARRDRVDAHRRSLRRTAGAHSPRRRERRPLPGPCGSSSSCIATRRPA